MLSSSMDSIRRDLWVTARAIGVRRVALTLLLLIVSLAFARYSWDVPVASSVERAMYDFRVWLLAKPAVPDPRITLITYRDETLINTNQRSPLQRGVLAKALTAIDALGPKAIGIDILIDQPQPQDDELIAALRSLKTPTYLAFANASTNASSIQFMQEDYQRQFLARLAGSNVHPASIRFVPDIDGVIRSWPDRPAGNPPLLADAMAGRDHSEYNERTSIAFRQPPPDAALVDLKADEAPPPPTFTDIPIDLLQNPALASLYGPHIPGRYVLIGGDIEEVDRFDTPLTGLTRQSTTGLQIHAAMLGLELDGPPRPRAPGPALWLLAVLVVGFAAALGYGEYGLFNIPLLILQTTLVLLLPFAFERWGFDSQSLPAFGWAAAWVLAYSASTGAARGVGSDQRRFAQDALGKYLPPEIARQIIRDPARLNLSGERRVIYALFSDIEGFTTLTHAIEPEQTAALLNGYLETMSTIVLEHGGTIDKFVGDAVVAFWGAPISHATDGDNAVRAAIAMAAAGDTYSAAQAADLPRLGRTRVGLHRGDAIVGNFGGEDRIQYTALGDVMNTAARLEGANKSLKTRVLISAEAAAGVTGVPLRPMGRVQVRGRSKPIFVFDVCEADTPEDLAALTALHTEFDKGDPEAQLKLAAYAEQRSGDVAVANLLYRLKSVGPGGCYALD